MIRFDRCCGANLVRGGGLCIFSKEKLHYNLSMEDV